MPESYEAPSRALPFCRLSSIKTIVPPLLFTVFFFLDLPYHNATHPSLVTMLFFFDLYFPTHAVVCRMLLASAGGGNPGGGGCCGAAVLELKSEPVHGTALHSSQQPGVHSGRVMG